MDSNDIIDLDLDFVYEVNDDRLAEDVPCGVCQYNLRGLALPGLCPECGTPAGMTRHGPMLILSPPEWVFRVASGFGWMCFGSVLFILAILAHLGMLAAWGRIPGPN